MSLFSLILLFILWLCFVVMGLLFFVREAKSMFVERDHKIVDIR